MGVLNDIIFSKRLLDLCLTFERTVKPGFGKRFGQVGVVGFGVVGVRAE